MENDVIGVEDEVLGFAGTARDTESNLIPHPSPKESLSYEEEDYETRSEVTEDDEESAGYAGKTVKDQPNIHTKADSENRRATKKEKYEMKINRKEEQRRYHTYNNENRRIKRRRRRRRITEGSNGSQVNLNRLERRRRSSVFREWPSADRELQVSRKRRHLYGTYEGHSSDRNDRSSIERSFIFEKYAKRESPGHRSNDSLDLRHKTSHREYLRSDLEDRESPLRVMSSDVIYGSEPSFSPTRISEIDHFNYQSYGSCNDLNEFSGPAGILGRFVIERSPIREIVVVNTPPEVQADTSFNSVEFINENGYVSEPLSIVNAVPERYCIITPSFQTSQSPDVLTTSREMEESNRIVYETYEPIKILQSNGRSQLSQEEITSRQSIESSSTYGRSQAANNVNIYSSYETVGLGRKSPTHGLTEIADIYTASMTTGSQSSSELTRRKSLSRESDRLKDTSRCYRRHESTGRSMDAHLYSTMRRSRDTHLYSNKRRYWDEISAERSPSLKNEFRKSEEQASVYSEHTTLGLMSSRTRSPSLESEVNRGWHKSPDVNHRRGDSVDRWIQYRDHISPPDQRVNYSPESRPYLSPTPELRPYLLPTPESRPYLLPTPESRPYLLPTPVSRPYLLPTPELRPYLLPTPEGDYRHHYYARSSQYSNSDSGVYRSDRALDRNYEHGQMNHYDSRHQNRVPIQYRHRSPPLAASRYLAYRNYYSRTPPPVLPPVSSKLLLPVPQMPKYNPKVLPPMVPPAPSKYVDEVP